jgi:hypothetical protein
MPNRVTHKIIFDVEKSAEIFAAVCPDGKFDFETLVPSPPHVYQGGLGKQEDEDFPINWHTWNNQNWGTKWNCYQQSCGIENEKAFIKFDTAWSIPYPIMAAFANKFNVPFEHRYYDEGHNYWGVEKWGTEHASDYVSRISKRRDDPKDDRALCIELKGYDPEDPERQ